MNKYVATVATEADDIDVFSTETKSRLSGDSVATQWRQAFMQVNNSNDSGDKCIHAHTRARSKLLKG